MFLRKNITSKEIISTKTKRKKQVSISFLGDKLRIALKGGKVFSAESIREIILHLGKLQQHTFTRDIAAIILVRAAWSILMGRLYLVKTGASSKRGQVNTHMVLECLIHLILRYMAGKPVRCFYATTVSRNEPQSTMGDSIKFLLDDYTVHPNFLYTHIRFR